jgi:hypothetical protein
MQPKNPNACVDLNTVDQVIALIPEWTWPVVKHALVTRLVDVMTTEVLERLTGNPTDDDTAQEMLDDYYKPDNRNQDVIVDCFKILGQEQTLYLLEDLNLDKISQEDFDGQP